MTKSERREMRQKRGLGRALRGLSAPVSGYGTYGPTRKATLYIGRVAGLDLEGWKEGSKISVQKAGSVVMGLRGGQVGTNASGTITVTEGRYKGTREPSTKVEIGFTGEGETPSAFRRHIKQLAEDTARVLAQREVLIEWIEPGKKMRTDTASPSGAPSPLAKVFCRWVREHSTSARTRPSDPCAIKKRAR